MNQFSVKEENEVHWFFKIAWNMGDLMGDQKDFLLSVQFFEIAFKVPRKKF